MASKEEEDLQQINLERQIGAVAANVEIRMEAVAEAAEIIDRGIKEVAK